MATNGMRVTAGAGVTFFSDLVHIGIARPVDREARWRVVAGFGTAF
jgi:ribosomal protein S17